MRKSKIFTNLFLFISFCIQIYFFYTIINLSYFYKFIKINKFLSKYIYLSEKINKSYKSFSLEENTLILSLPSINENYLIISEYKDFFILKNFPNYGTYLLFYPSNKSIRREIKLFLKNIETKFSILDTMISIKYTIKNRIFIENFYINPYLIKLP